MKWFLANYFFFFFLPGLETKLWKFDFYSRSERKTWRSILRSTPLYSSLFIYLPISVYQHFIRFFNVLSSSFLRLDNREHRIVWFRNNLFSFMTVTQRARRFLFFFCFFFRSVTVLDSWEHDQWSLSPNILRPISSRRLYFLSSRRIIQCFFSYLFFVKEERDYKFFSRVFLFLLFETLILFIFNFICIFFLINLAKDKTLIFQNNRPCPIRRFYSNVFLNGRKTPLSWPCQYRVQRHWTKYFSLSVHRRHSLSRMNVRGR